MVSNSYDAEVGRFSGGQIQVTSKSGTNEVHGSAFFKASRPGLNAYQRWNGLGSDVAGTAASRGLNRDESRFNNYGGSLGGPFWRNRIFGFFNYETSPYSASSTAQGWYETSQFDSSCCGERQHRLSISGLQRRGRRQRGKSDSADVLTDRPAGRGQLRDHDRRTRSWFAVERSGAWNTGPDVWRLCECAGHGRRIGWRARRGILQHGEPDKHHAGPVQRTPGCKCPPK